MKQMIIALAVLLSACSKPEQKEIITTLLYRIEQTDIDGTVTLSPVKRITPNINSSTTDEDEDEEDDDDDENEDDHDCYPLAIDFESITVVETKTGDIKVEWQAASESTVDHYSVQRSTNSKDWTNRSFTPVNGTGKYLVLDKK